MRRALDTINLLKKTRLSSSNTAVKLIIAVAVSMALVFIVYIGRVPYGSQPQIGKVSDKTIYAPFDFSYDAGNDTERTEELKRIAALSVKDVYDINADVFENTALKVSAFFSALYELEGAGEINLQDEVNRLTINGGLGLSESTIKALLESGEPERLESVLLSRLENLYSQGIISPEEKESLISQGKTAVIVRNPNTRNELKVDISGLKTPDELKPQLTSLFDESIPDDKLLKDALAEIAGKVLAANLKSDIVEISSRREKAIASVLPQKKLIDVKKDELVIQKGERVTHFHVAKVEAIRLVSTKEGQLAVSIFGILLIVAASVTILAMYLACYEPVIFSNNRHLILIAFVLVVITTIGKAVYLSGEPAYFIPVAMGPMLIALLLGARPAIVVAITSSLLVGLIAGEKFDSTLIFLVGSIVGVYSVRDVRKRSQLFKAGVFVGAAGIFCVVGMGILNNLELMLIFNDSIGFLINGIAVGAIITGTLHIFEYISQITTNITLLELADPNNPLLKELILKAPGTYHHSLIVGNLAESACEAIGANGLLARVGAYYHDIGKVEKSEYFAENQPMAESRHDKLEPTMSSLIIINHVKEGLEKAKKAHLNKALLDFIEQHHGTGLMYYFYQRALESVEDLAKLEEEGFRYPGPKPQTKETAIVHLADSVEAASRTLSNPTPSNLEELVHRITNNKFIDGQLDECELTLKDLNLIAVTFTKVLTGVYHTRVQYPNGNHKNGDQS